MKIRSFIAAFLTFAAIMSAFAYPLAASAEETSEDFLNVLSWGKDKQDIGTPEPCDYEYRMWGNGRIETAVEISKEGWSRASCAVIAYGMNYADALASAPLAAALDCPILLTENPYYGLEWGVQQELYRLGASRIYIVGGKLVVSEKIENSLKQTYGSGNVIRLSGTNRYGTSIAIAKKLLEVRKQKGLGSFDNAFFCSADGFADALAISLVAGIKLDPILYAPKYDKYLSKESPEMITYLKSLAAGGLKTTTLVGGVYAVAEKAGNEIRTITGRAPERVDAGVNGGRYDTMLTIWNRYSSCFSGREVCVATGTNFPDALAGAVYAAKYNMPIVLVGYEADSKQSKDIRNFAASKRIGFLYVFGGEYAVPEQRCKMIFEDITNLERYVYDEFNFNLWYYGYEHSYVMPQLSIYSDYADEINDSIADNVLWNIYEAVVDIENGYDPMTYKAGYTAAIHGDILSLLVYNRIGEYHADSFYIYNIDIITGRKVSTTEVLSKAGYTLASFKAKAKKTITPILNNSDCGYNVNQVMSSINANTPVFYASYGDIFYIADLYDYWTDEMWTTAFSLNSGHQYFLEDME